MMISLYMWELFHQESMRDKVLSKDNDDRGKKKQKLCPTTIEYIKKQCFFNWPLQPDERKEDEWVSCIIAIDEGNRRLNRVTKATTNATKLNKKLQFFVVGKL